MLVEGDFEPVNDEGGYNYKIKCQTLEFPHDAFVKVIVAEMTLRGLIQRCDSIEKKLEQPVSTPEDKAKVKEWEEEIQGLQKEICMEQHALYRCEAFLPHRPLKQMYDALRENSTWYCRPELVKDCAERGGCCGRSCRCCQKRHLTTQRTKGIGHCTIDCSCCSEMRGADPTPEERAAILKMLTEMLRSPNPAYLVKMIGAYFSKPAYFTEVGSSRKE
jgi:hypothetical protein